MKQIISILIFLLALSSVSAFSCGDAWSSDISLTKDLFCPDGLTTTRPGLRLNCNGNMLHGDKTGTAILIAHDNTIVENCNVKGFFTGIAVNTAVNTLIKNSFITNASTAIHIDAATQVLIQNVRIANTTYFDLYEKDAKGIVLTQVTLKNHTRIVDLRPPPDQIVAEQENYTFKRESLPLLSVPARADLAPLNLSWDDYLRARASVSVLAMVNPEEGKAVYEMAFTARRAVENLSVAVFLPLGFTSYLFLRSEGALFSPSTRLLVFPEFSLAVNQTEVLRFEATTEVPQQELMLPLVVPLLSRARRPSQDTAKNIMMALFALAALLFVGTKRFLLREPVTLKEQFGLLAGVLALWAMTYKLAIEALQFAKDFMMFLTLLGLVAYYLFYLFKHHKSIENL